MPRGKRKAADAVDKEEPEPTPKRKATKEERQAAVRRAALWAKEEKEKKKALKAKQAADRKANNMGEDRGDDDDGDDEDDEVAEKPRAKRPKANPSASKSKSPARPSTAKKARSPKKAPTPAAAAAAAFSPVARPSAAAAPAGTTVPPATTMGSPLAYTHPSPALLYHQLPQMLSPQTQMHYYMQQVAAMGQQQMGFGDVQYQQQNAHLPHGPIFGTGAQQGYGTGQASLYTAAQIPPAIAAKVPPPPQAPVPTPSSTVKKTVSSRKTPPKAAKKTQYDDDGGGDDDDDDEDLVAAATPLELSQQLSMQVVRNAEALGQNRPTNDHPPPGLDRQDDGDADTDDLLDNDGEDDDDSEPIVVDYIDDDLPVKRRVDFTEWLPVIVGVIAVGALLFLAISVVDLCADFLTPPCYVDSATGLGCADVKPHHVFSCPDGGLCRDGKLVDCPQLFHEMNVYKDACVLTGAKKVFGDKLLQTLWRVSYEGRDCDDMEFPLFKYSELRMEDPTVLVEQSEQLLKILAAEGYGIFWEDGDAYIQLPKKHQKKLVHCEMRDQAKETFDWVASGILDGVKGIFVASLAIAGSLLVNLWTLATASMAHVVCFIVVLGLFFAGTWQNYLASHQRLVDNGVGLVLDKLRDANGQAITHNHIRDEVAGDLFPQGGSKQKKWIETVWPKVKKQVSKERAITNTDINVGNKPTKAWKSTAARKATFAS